MFGHYTNILIFIIKTNNNFNTSFEVTLVFPGFQKSLLNTNHKGAPYKGIFLSSSQLLWQDLYFDFGFMP